MANPYFLEAFSLDGKPKATRVFLAEGKSEVGFIEKYLSRLNVDPLTTAVLCFRGLSRTHGHSQTLAKLLAKSPGGGLERIKGIGLMADADTNPNARVDLVIECAKAFGFEKSANSLRSSARYEHQGRRFSFALSPGLNQQGNIETCIVSEIGPTPLFACVQAGVPCFERAIGQTLTDKAKVQMFISAKSNGSMAGVQNAFEASYFDVEHAVYDASRAMIRYVLEL
jgi:hypothetical protein